MRGWLACALLIAGCDRCRSSAPTPAVVVAPTDAAAPVVPAIDAWAGLPAPAQLAALELRAIGGGGTGARVQRLPAGWWISGPAVGAAWLDDGFAVRAQLPASAPVAPPAQLPDGSMVVLAGCVRPPLVAAPAVAVGCLTVMGPAGDLRFAGPVPAPAALAADLDATGRPWRLVDASATAVRWARGSVGLEVDLDQARARTVKPGPDGLEVAYQGEPRWVVLDGRDLVARDVRGRIAWQGRRPVDALVGLVPGDGHAAPMLRTAQLGGLSGPVSASEPPDNGGTGTFGGRGPGWIELLDVDVEGGQRGQAAFPIPGDAILAHAIGTDGTAALAVQTGAGGHVLAYDPQGNHLWAWRLPGGLADLALAVEAGQVVVFHDSRRVTVLALPGS